jgi:hypothetical protein
MTSENCEELCMCIDRIFTSPNVSDSNGEPANMVDVGSDIAGGLYAIADAINRLADSQPAREGSVGHAI